jgi:hypothetical protein
MHRDRRPPDSIAQRRSGCRYAEVRPPAGDDLESAGIDAGLDRERLR